jgi:hypothetical protein
VFEKTYQPICPVAKSQQHTLCEPVKCLSAPTQEGGCLAAQGHTMHETRMSSGPASTRHFLHNMGPDEQAAFDRDWMEAAGPSFLHSHMPGHSAQPHILAGPSTRAGVFQDMNVGGRQVSISCHLAYRVHGWGRGGDAWVGCI